MSVRVALATTRPPLLFLAAHDDGHVLQLLTAYCAPLQGATLHVCAAIAGAPPQFNSETDLPVGSTQVCVLYCTPPPHVALQPPHAEYATTKGAAGTVVSVKVLVAVAPSRSVAVTPSVTVRDTPPLSAHESTVGLVEALASHENSSPSGSASSRYSFAV